MADEGERGRHVATAEDQVGHGVVRGRRPVRVALWRGVLENEVGRIAGHLLSKDDLGRSCGRE